MKFSRAGAVALGLLLGSSIVAGCSSEPTGHGGESGKPNPADTGSVGLSLVAGGVTIDSATYTITGPNGFSLSGSFAVTDQIATTINGLPAGSGFTITLTALAGDASVCAGSATFTVIAGATTNVTVHLQCQTPKTTGSISVNGTLNFCPTINFATATPSQVTVGSSVALNASATDADNGPGPITFDWTAPSGTFSSATIASPTFTCTTAGTVTITLTISDSDCGDTESISVTCLPGANDASAPDAAVTVDAAPDVAVVDATPDVSVIDATPDVSVVDATPDVSVVDAAPDVSVVDAAPDVAVVDAAPDVVAVVDSAPPPSPCSPGGSTTACFDSLGAGCLDCVTQNGCFDPTQLGGTCELTTGTLAHLTAPLADGTTCATAFGTATTETQICLQTLGDVFNSKCAATLQETPCLCGTTDPTGCLAGTVTPNGPLFDLYQCDFDTTSVQTIQSDITVQTFGAGQANSLVQCAAAFACNSCFGQ